ncbi:unnamed protein product [Lampetra planeri]
MEYNEELLPLDPSAPTRDDPLDRACRVQSRLGADCPSHFGKMLTREILHSITYATVYHERIASGQNDRCHIGEGRESLYARKAGAGAFGGSTWSRLDMHVESPRHARGVPARFSELRTPLVDPPLARRLSSKAESAARLSGRGSSRLTPASGVGGLRAEL